MSRPARRTGGADGTVIEAAAPPLRQPRARLPGRLPPRRRALSRRPSTPSVTSADDRRRRFRVAGAGTSRAGRRAPGSARRAGPDRRRSCATSPAVIFRNHSQRWRPAHPHFSVFTTALAARLVTQWQFPRRPPRRTTRSSSGAEPPGPEAHDSRFRPDHHRQLRSRLPLRPVRLRAAGQPIGSPLPRRVRSWSPGWARPPPSSLRSLRSVRAPSAPGAGWCGAVPSPGRGEVVGDRGSLVALLRGGPGRSPAAGARPARRPRSGGGRAPALRSEDRVRRSRGR